MRIDEYKNHGMGRPDRRKPKPEPASGIVGEDGFTYYACIGECGQTKMAALFLPIEIERGTLICRACSGEVSIKATKARKPTAAQQFRVVEQAYASAPVHIPTRTPR